MPHWEGIAESRLRVCVLLNTLHIEDQNTHLTCKVRTFNLSGELQRAVLWLTLGFNINIRKELRLRLARSDGYRWYLRYIKSMSFHNNWNGNVWMLWKRVTRKKRKSKEQRGTGDTKNSSVVDLEKQFSPLNCGRIWDTIIMSSRVAGWPKFGLIPKRKHICGFIMNVSGLKTPSRAKIYSTANVIHSPEPAFIHVFEVVHESL